MEKLKLYFWSRGTRGGVAGVVGLEVRMVDGVRNFLCVWIFLCVRNFFSVRIGCPRFFWCQEFLYISGCPDACACVHVAGVEWLQGLGLQGWG